MSIVAIPGGQAELREKLTVAGKDATLEESVALLGLLREKFPNAKDPFEEFKKVDLKEHPEFLDRDLLHVFNRTQRVGIVAWLKSWTLDEPVPRTIEDVGELDVDLYEALSKHIAPLLAKAQKGIDTTTVSLDPESPTSPSSDSDEGGPEATTPTTTPPSGSSDDTDDSDTSGSSPD